MGIAVTDQLIAAKAIARPIATPQQCVVYTAEVVISNAA